MSKGDFMTIQEAAQRLGKSDLTIRRWIKSGKLDATMVDNRWDIPESALIDISNDISYINHDSTIGKTHLLEEIQFLRKENEQLRKHLEEKDKAIEESRHRQDTIIMQLTRQLENHQKLLEYKETSWYRRLFRKRPSSKGLTENI